MHILDFQIVSLETEKGRKERKKWKCQCSLNLDLNPTNDTVLSSIWDTRWCHFVAANTAQREAPWLSCLTINSLNDIREVCIKVQTNGKVYHFRYHFSHQW